ncbi:MAG: CinA family nicotinamide mononucleotide deamidase-related protein [Chloroflexi bacterium]|nr:MAG: CinA family nicotinamide mononucleotide deamidase-related protein [Chloroflexota bacterium]
MTRNINAEVISIGTEILLGELTDTNSVYIARVLRDLGINLYFMTSVGDNQKRIADAIRLALSRAQVVITCGGLGPTVDDMTRQAVANATDRGLTFHQTLLDQIAQRFAEFKVKMTENNRRQAYLPDDAIVVENPVGTAPAFIVEHGDGVVISLPGVPREMKFLMQEKIVPYLRQKYQLGIIKARTLKSAGIGESALDELIGDDLLQNANPTIGLAAHMGQIDIRITAKASTEAEADQLIAEMETKIRARVGSYIFGVDDQQLEVVLINLLQTHHAKITLIHAGIDNVLEQALLQIEAASDSIAQSRTFATPVDLLKAYQLDDKTSSLSEAVEQVAKLAQQETKSDVTIVMVAHPDVDEGDDKTVATVLCVATKQQIRTRVYGFGAKSDFARAWGRSWLFSNAWRMLKEEYDAN